MILINRRQPTATFNLRIERLYAMRRVIGTSDKPRLIENRGTSEEEESNLVSHGSVAMPVTYVCNV